MYKDFKELLSVLNAHRVKYLIVGGYAVSLHAEPRATKDLDILVGPGAENGKAVFAALAEFGAPLEGLTPQDFVEPGNFFRMGSPPVMVDMLAAKLAAGRPQDLADVEALGEHLVPAEHRTFESEASPSASDMETARKQAVTDWLAYRAQQQAMQGSAQQKEQSKDEGKDAGEDP